VHPSGSPLPAPIELNEHTPAPGQFVAVIGYAAVDGRVPDKDLMEELFGKVWEKKHFSPGTVIVFPIVATSHNRD
jgi:hypothetical protein